MGSDRRVSRRSFSRWSLASLLLPAGACRAGVEQRGVAGTSSPPERSKVVVARDDKVRSGRSRLDEARVLDLLDRSLQALYGCDSSSEAWRRVAGLGKVIGLKVNCLAGKGASTHRVLVEAVCERLQQAGVRPENLVVWDRLSSDLESAGFRINERGNKPRCIGNDVYGYDSKLMTFGRVGSLVCNTLTRHCDAVINLPVLKDHSIAGVTIALKNFFGAIHNPNKYHLNVGDPYVADVYMLEPIRTKVKLHICDAFNVQYEGGPSYLPQWSWPYNGLLVSADPVALDTIGRRIIEEKRAAEGFPSLKDQKREPAYILTAADNKHRLGIADPGRIDVVEV